jgi:peptidoglycan/LPS O-acetylase OafA/YrhL
LHSLDGLRGIAAVVVLIHHALLTVPDFAAPYYTTDGISEVSGAAWVMTYTPLHLLWAGSEAVYLFFILSGIVLTLPVLRREHFDWKAYYPSRLIRLYGPVIVAVLVGLALISLVPRREDVDLGEWMVARPDAYPPLAVLKDMLLLTGVSDVISPLWSLRWEVLFSLLLPLYILFGTRAKGLVAAKVAVIAVLIALASILRVDSVLYLLIFAVGVLGAVHWSALSQLARPLDASRWAWPVLVTIGALLTCSSWLAKGIGMDVSAGPSVQWLAVPGVALIVFAGAFWSPIRRALERRPSQWLGSISFSLYLVHEPIIIASRLLLPIDQPWIAVTLAGGASFLLASVFTRVVEKPTHRLAKAVHHFIEGRDRMKRVPATGRD